MSLHSLPRVHRHALLMLDVGEKTTTLVDMTFPAATATSNEMGTRKWPQRRARAVDDRAQ